MPDWEWRWHAEIEKFPSAVLAARHPKSVNLGDVNAEDFVERAIQAGRPDILVFGSPCQDFSLAGQRVGLDGDHGNLALVALGIAAKLRPRWLVFENVPGLLSSQSGSAEAISSLRNRGLSGDAGIGEYTDAEEDSDFAAFLALVQQCGYFGCYRITDAQFAGVPQRRRRIFFVGYLGDWRPAAAVLLEPESLRGDCPPSRKTGEGIAPTISARPTGGGGLGTDFDLDGGLDESAVEPYGPVGAVSSKWAKGTGGPAGDECYNLIAFTSKDYGGIAAIDQSPTLRAMSFDGSHANGGGQVAVAFSSATEFLPQSSRVYSSSESSPTLQSTGKRNGNRSPQVAVPELFKPSHFTRGKDGEPSGISPPLGAEPDKGDQDPVLFTGTAVRRLTPRECERLQSYEDDYTLIKFRGKSAADGPRYKALGNSMNVKEIGWVLSRIDQFEKTVIKS